MPDPTGNPVTTRTQPQPREHRADAALSPARCTRSRRKQLSWGAAHAVWRLLRSAWDFVRQVSGDDAYERYRAHMLEVHADQPAMTRREHYRMRTEQKWNRVTRCC